jgi:hypothetical protein
VLRRFFVYLTERKRRSCIRSAFLALY